VARIGLVLGAGGMTGGAFHAGVLAALAECGWDARTAEVVVGTSAGSVSGAVLRAGLPPVDLLARIDGRPLTDEGRSLVGALGSGPPPLPRFPLRPADRGRRRLGVDPALVRSVLTRPWHTRPGSVLAALLPHGTVPNDVIAEGFDALFADRWPDEPLWICAVRLRDGRRVVFGRPPAATTSVGTAVAASCAIPGYFAPVSIDGVDHVDGGAHSPTNLDLLAGRDLDLVVVSSPMSITGRAQAPGPEVAVRRACRVMLQAEAARVRRRGTPVLSFQPTAEVRAAMGNNAMNPDRRRPTASRSHESARRRLERPDVADLVATLAGS
jgi:NTE family protein